MGAKSGSALRLLQLTLRSVLLVSAALILAVYSYFLAALSNHKLPTPTEVRAVEGIAGSAVLYSFLALLLLCCVPSGVRAASLGSLILDLAFAGAFIYVAVANKGGAGSCQGYVDTPFGKGKDGDTAEGSGGFTALPSFRTACKLQTACLAVSILAIFFLLFSMGAELALIRHRRKEQRFGPSPANNYTSGYGKSGGGGGNGFFARLFGRKDADDSAGAEENMLPKHTTPGELGTDNSNTTTTDNMAIGGATYPYNPDYLPPTNVKQETGYGYAPANTGVGGGYSSSSPYHQQDLPQHYRYDDGIYERA